MNAKVFSLLFLCAALAGCVSVARRPPFELARYGAALADIVVPGHADENVRFAADELKRHLDLITGADFAFVRAPVPGRASIIVAYARDLEAQELRIAFAGSSIRLESGAYPEYAAWDFLHDYCGVSWLDPTDAGTVVPHDPDLCVEARGKVGRPFFRGRAMGGWSGGRSFSGYSPELWERDSPGWTNYVRTAYPSVFAKGAFENPYAEIARRQGLFLRRMKAGGELCRTGHSFYGWYDRFWRRKGPKFERWRPELFAKGYDDMPAPPQLCYSNPETIAQAVADVRDYFDNGGTSWGDGSCCLEPMDNAMFCGCERCVRQYRPELRSVNAEHSDYWFRFVNAVAREVAKTHPGKTVTTLAYWSHTGAPSFRLEPNVEVHFCFTYNRMPYASVGWRREVRQLREWRREYPGREFGLWLYNTFPKERVNGAAKFNVFPGFFARALCDEYALFRELDISKNVYNCGFVDDYENFLSLRWMWNPLEDLVDLEDEYFSSYGAAAGPIREFYRIVEGRYSNPATYAFDKRGRDPHQTPEIAWGYLGTSGVMRRLAALMAEAERLADTPLAKSRVANWRRGVWEYMLAGAAAL